jgi:RimJ/RimL family protein N-acetyltransferase
MKPLLIGSHIYLREIQISDAEFVYSLRCNPELNAYLSPPPLTLEHQRAYIERYLTLDNEYYFSICNSNSESLGVVRIYDLKPESFCWGSWVVKPDAPRGVGLASLLLVYDYGFYGLHYAQSHFDVRKGNVRVLDLHKRLGAVITSEDELNYYFIYTEEAYRNIRARYLKMITR